MTTMKSRPRYAIRRLNLVGLTAIVVALGGVGGWASTTQIAGAVIANGTVAVETSAKKVQHLNGGIVGEVLVKEGSKVETGQILMRLDDTLTRATLGVVQSQLELYVVREARLLAERDGLESVIFPARDGPTREIADSAIAGEKRLFWSRREGHAPSPLRHPRGRVKRATRHGTYRSPGHLLWRRSDRGTWWISA
jgi:HlyD family secretion protein